jgi:hypothetical protein
MNLNFFLIYKILINNSITKTSVTFHSIFYIQLRHNCIKLLFINIALFYKPKIYSKFILNKVLTEPELNLSDFDEASLHRQD